MSVLFWLTKKVPLNRPVIFEIENDVISQPISKSVPPPTLKKFGKCIKAAANAKFHEQVLHKKKKKALHQSKSFCLFQS